MGEHEGSGLSPEEEGRENSSITPEALKEASELAEKLELTTPTADRREILDTPAYRDVHKMEMEAHDTNDLVELGANRFGLSPQETANNQALLSALYELLDLEDHRSYVNSEIDLQIAGLEAKRAKMEKDIKPQISETEEKIRGLAVKSPDQDK